MNRSVQKDLSENKIKECEEHDDILEREDIENNNKNLKKPEENFRYSVDVDVLGITAEEKGRRAWNQYLLRDNSFITDLFLGLFRSTLK